VTRLKSIEEGQLNQELLEVEGAGELADLGHSANALQTTLYEIMTVLSLGAEDMTQQSEELSQSSSEVKAGSEQVAITMQELSIGTENQAHSASQLSANMEAFNHKFMDVSETTEKVTVYSEDVLTLSGKGKELMNSSSQQMEKINEIVQDATVKMTELDKGTKEITKLVDIIQNVSKQTNLLALNAAIEAARAGEHGRGFAVVAEEVRKLSEQVAVSVKEITLFVENINHEANDVSASLQEGFREAEAGLVGIKETNLTFDEITHSLQSVVEHINGVSTSLNDLTETGKEMNHSISEIASVSEESAAGVEETSAASQQINSTMEEVAVNAGQIAKLAENLGEIVQKFQLYP
ncbi:MAG TPA: methyl-accepting chemotaxis protein, partial [Candidatus Jeotgalibaca merdavium]|nr:methyl-accepting chemotaxis protein [Candidatus Jeotgalibaca merdavium]